jgi:adenylate cyclase
VLNSSLYLTALVSLGIAWAFVRADPESNTSRALAVGLAMVGLAVIGSNLRLEMSQAGPLPRWASLLIIPELFAFLAFFEWVRLVRLTIPSGDLRTTFGDKTLRIAQGLVIFYGLNAIFHSELFLSQFFGGVSSPADWSMRVILLFAAPVSLAMLLWAASIVLCLNRRPDPAERVRLVAFLIACPVIAAGIVLPRSIAPISTVLGLIMLLAGAMRHAQLRGRRGLFMSRFLSPQVAALVNREGLHAAMREDCHELSIVCCDLRGFTAFAGGHSSGEVLKLLREYYDAVGDAAVEVEGTIKDYAGDGVLILIGAPMRMDDHAARAVRLAARVRAAVTEIIQRWSSDEYPLGIGVGVASGLVTVGVIGGEGRLEYAAVGQPGNLASRLCDQAAAQDVLIDPHTLKLIGDDSNP